MFSASARGWLVIKQDQRRYCGFQSLHTHKVSADRREGGWVRVPPPTHTLIDENFTHTKRIPIKHNPFRRVKHAIGKGFRHMKVICSLLSLESDNCSSVCLSTPQNHKYRAAIIISIIKLKLFGVSSNYLSLLNPPKKHLILLFLTPKDEIIHSSLVIPSPSYIQLAW